MKAFQTDAFDAGAFEAFDTSNAGMSGTISFTISADARTAVQATSTDGSVAFEVNNTTVRVGVIASSESNVIGFSSPATAARRPALAAFDSTFSLSNESTARLAAVASASGTIPFTIITTVRNLPVISATNSGSVSFQLAASSQVGVPASLSGLLSNSYVLTARSAVSASLSSSFVPQVSSTVRSAAVATMNSVVSFNLSSKLMIGNFASLDVTVAFASTAFVRTAVSANVDKAIAFSSTGSALVPGYIEVNQTVPFTVAASVGGLSGATFARMDTSVVEFTVQARGTIDYSLATPNNGTANGAIPFTVRAKVKTNTAAIEANQPAMVFPLKPDWTNGAQITLAHKTDIFKSRAGKEQRRAIRSTPRRTLTYTSMVHRSEYNDFAKLMAKNQYREFAMPDWTRSVQTRGAASGALEIQINGLPPPWMTYNTDVFLVEGTKIFRSTINSASWGNVKLGVPTDVEFSPAMVIRPLLMGRVATISATAETSNLMNINIDFDVTPGFVPNSEDEFGAHIVSGKEVFAFPWNWGESVEAEYSWSVEQVDFNRGVVNTHYPINFGDTTQRCTLLRQGDEIDYLMRFLERQKGQRNIFWMPSAMSDMELATDGHTGDTIIEIAGTDAWSLFANDQVQKGVAIICKDGRRIFRRINGIGLSEGKSLVNISEPLSSDVSVDMVAKISWMRPARFASDDATIEFVTEKVAKAQFATMSLPYDSDPQDYASLDGAGLWTMDQFGEGSEFIFKGLDVAINEMWGSQ